MWWLLVIALVLVAGVVFVGAPYVPTHRASVGKLFDLVEFNDGRLVDLGAGDGRLLKAAAERGIKATGYELSPIIWAAAWWNLRSCRKLADIQLKNYWNIKLPDDTTVVFTFLASRFMGRLEAYLSQEAKRLGRPLTLVSYGFRLDGQKTVKESGALLVYIIKP